MDNSEDSKTIPQLTYSNWGVWHKKFKGYLQYKGMAGALADAESAHSEKALGAMTHHVGVEFLYIVSEAGSAKAAWDTLHVIFAQRSAANYAQQMQEYYNFEQHSGESVSAYIARLTALVHDIKSAGGKIDDKDQVIRMLTGLRSEFHTISTIIQNEDPLPSIHAATAKLLVEEKKVVPKHNKDAAFFGHSKGHSSGSSSSGWKQHHNRSGSSSRFRSSSRDRFRGRQHSRERHNSRDRASSADRSSKSSMRCWICGKKGHKKNECWHNKEQTDRQNQPSREVNFVSTFTASDKIEFRADEWVIDSGAGRHSTGNRSVFFELEPLTIPRSIQYGNGEELPATHQGSIILNRGGGVHTRTVLRDVLYVPGQQANLMSVRQISEAGGEVSISSLKGTCYITFEDKRVMTAATHKSGLWAVQGCKYEQNSNKNSSNSSFAATAAEVPPSAQLQEAQKWHRRYGHLSFKTLGKMARANLVQGMEGISAGAFLEADKRPCEQCHQSKQTRQPFRSTGHSSSKVLDLLHSDLSGPISPPTLEGEKFVITLQDDYSGLSMVQLLKNKSDAAASLKHMITRMECQTEQKVKQIRTDNGTEYVNNNLSAFFSSKGIIQQNTMPFSPEQNGVAERVNRTLMERARAMLIESGLQQELWGEAVLTANFLRNRALSASKEGTPYEMFFNKKPDVSFLRPFGSTAYVHVPKEKRSGKLAARSETGRMVGYLSEGAGYRIYIPDEGRFIHSRNITFNEDYKDIPPQQDSSYHTAGSNKHVTFQLDDDLDDLPALDEPDDVVPSDDESDDEEQQGGSGGPSDAATPAAGGQTPAGPAATAGAAASSGRPIRSTRGQHSKYSDFTLAATDVASATIPEPKSYTEALKSEQHEQWQQAMDDEYNSLLELGTWTLVKTPADVTPIPVKWVYKVKRDGSGRIERFKARLVAKGFRQQEGIDYNEVYAPVSKYSTFRTLMSMAAAEDLEVHQLDIKTAFLQGELAELVYIEQPQGYEEGSSDMCCLLNKAIYGLKQAPRTWHTRLSQELESMGFTASEADPGLYVRHDKHESTFLLSYVDDILVISKQLSTVISTKQRLMAAFDARDLGEAVTYLGINIYRNRGSRSISLMQQRMAADIINNFNLTDSKAVTVPSNSSVKLTKKRALHSAKMCPTSSLLAASCTCQCAAGQTFHLPWEHCHDSCHAPPQCTGRQPRQPHATSREQQITASPTAATAAATSAASSSLATAILTTLETSTPVGPPLATCSCTTEELSAGRASVSPQ